MLAKAMTTAHPRNTSLGIAPSLIARQFVFERVSFRRSFKAASVSLAANCMFIVMPIDGLRPVFYTERESTLKGNKVPVSNGCA
jgi:hypothetical protein